MAGATVARMDTARRGSRRRDLLVSLISTVVFFAAVVALIVASPGVNKVVESFFSASGFEDSFGTVSEGFWLNVKLMLLAEALVLVVGMAIAVIRSLPGPALAPLRIVAIGAEIVKERPDDVDMTGQFVTNEQYGVVFEKGNSLREPVNEAIEKIKADGTLEELQAKWFPGSEDLPELK